MSSSNVSGVTNHFPKANEGFIKTTDASLDSASATEVGLNSVSGLTNGDVFVGIIEPGVEAKEETFTGLVDTSGSQITNVKWTRGSRTTHAGGSTVVDYVTGTHLNIMSKGIQEEHNQDGTHSDVHADTLEVTGASTLADVTVDSITINGAATSEGWAPLGATPNTITALGQKSYQLVFNGNDLTDTLSNGMRLQMTRAAAAPTQCTSLNGSSQYFNDTTVSGMTFTDDFAVSAWIKLNAYGAVSNIASRYNGTSGWSFEITSTGRLALYGFNAGSSNFSGVLSYVSVPTGRWVHVAAQLDMSAFTGTSTTSYIMIDGADVTPQVSRGGTNPTALVQAGNLEIGTKNAGSFFNGKIAQVAIYSAKVTQATMLASMNQTLTGSETSLISGYTFNNSITDLNTSNANNLTAQGSAVATNADSPFALDDDGVPTGSTEVGIVHKVSFSTNTTVTVQVPEGCAVPTTGGLSSVSYSITRTPYGFPASKNRWRLWNPLRENQNTTSNASYGAFIGAGFQLTVPIGEWTVGHQYGVWQNSTTTAVYVNLSPTALTGLTITTGQDASPFAFKTLSPSAAETDSGFHINGPATVSSAQVWTVYTLGSTSSSGPQGAQNRVEIYAENAYI